MGFWKNIKNAFISETENELVVNTEPEVKNRKKYDFDTVNEWLQFCIECDKEMKLFFDDVARAVFFSIAEHFPVLQAKSKQLTYTDDYGVMQDAGWLKEIMRFEDSVILPRLEALKGAPFVLHKVALKKFMILYNTFLPGEEPLVEEDGIITGFLVDDTDVVQDNFEKLRDIFIDHEEYAKKHKNNKKCQKFLSLKNRQIMYLIKKGDYLGSFKMHLSLPDLFMCLMHIPDDKSSEIALPWTKGAFDFFQLVIDLEQLVRDFIRETSNPNKLLEDIDENAYWFLFKTWLDHNIAMLFGIIFNESPEINKEHILMGVHAKNFGNKKNKKIQSPKTGLEYEKIITAKLKELGFNAKTTKASGDQGADVLANKDGVSFAIQCKLYTKPVGNKAVQEANAARDFYKKDYAVVVSNAGYTKSARTAANACDVILINDTQLEKLLEYV